jgi:hypothetical protein
MNDAVRLERLRTYLNKVMDDRQIVRNPRFMPAGVAKIARFMGVDDSEVQGMIDALADKLRAELSEEVDDNSMRYSYEEDTLGGLTIHDSKTGREKYLNVTASASLLTKIDDGLETEQVLLAAAMQGTLDESRELSAEEMGTNTSSFFNFPWKLNESAGFASAQFSGFGPNFNLQVVSVVDHDGNPVDVDPKALTKIAKDFINEA